jgi:hypothetical protein
LAKPCIEAPDFEAALRGLPADVRSKFRKVVALKLLFLAIFIVEVILFQR